MAHKGIVSSTAALESQSFNFNFNDLILQGDAHFKRGPSNNPVLCLTNPVRNSSGQVNYATLINFRQPGEQVQFETTVKFLTKPVDDNQGKLVFFMAPKGTIFPPTPSGPKPIFSVEFVTSRGDTKITINIPYDKEVAILDVGDELLNNDVTAIIQYGIVQNKYKVTVTVTPSNYPPFGNVCDLSKVLDQQVEVGLAAFTGDTVGDHNVFKWDFTSTSVNGKAAEE